MIEVNNYTVYRGKCKELSEEYVRNNPNTRLVRGYYHCPVWGRQEHWWVEFNDGSLYEGMIIDPSIKQFPSWAYATKDFYEEFDGICTCEQCGKSIPEEEVYLMGRYPTCGGACAARLVGL